MKHSTLALLILILIDYVTSCDFKTEYSWSYINFTWRSYDDYQKAIRLRNYIPENVVPGGIKFYKDKVYITVPKFRRGVPVTLTYIPKDDVGLDNLLVPFPNWKVNDDRHCGNLQSVLGMEIDTKGVMWVLDGVRINNNNIECPPKILLLDLNNNGKLIQRYKVPRDISFQNGGFMNDLVVDESDGDFAYITDNSVVDPGLIIFSRRQNRAWKIRDRSMFPELRASINYRVRNDLLTQLYPIDGIAMSPPQRIYGRTVFYTSLTGVGVYGINTTILKDEETCRSEGWRRRVEYLGDKEAQSDGMIMDSRGDLYYGIIPLYGVGRWNMFEPFETSEIVDINERTMVWNDGFGMDQMGYLYLISNWAYRFFNLGYELRLTPEVKFRIHKCYIGSKSYLYNE